MLQDFLKANRAVLIDRCHTLAAVRNGRSTVYHESQHGIPVFLEQLIKTLSDEQAVTPVNGAARGPSSNIIDHSELEDMATLHGRELLDRGFTLEQVVRDYGDVCQAVTNLAIEIKAPIEVYEFRTFNRCLDNAISAAATEYVQRQATVAIEGDPRAANARLALLVHELQKDLQTASAQTENVCLSATTGGALGRSLSKMRTLIDRALAEVRVSAGAKARLRPINIAAFLGEVTASAAPNSIKQGCHFAATVPDNGLLINVDPELMSSTIGNLLQNAFKFTNCNADVRLRAHLVSDRILIEVENEPSIPPADAASTLPADFAPGIEDRSELGPDLQICRRRVELNNGILSVRSLPGRGRIFTIDLPRFIHPAPAG